MKAIKLKPLFFPQDDILVKPPELFINQEKYMEKLKNKTVSTMDQLKTILRGRQLKKQDQKKKPQLEQDRETVQKLSE